MEVCLLLTYCHFPQDFFHFLYTHQKVFRYFGYRIAFLILFSYQLDRFLIRSFQASLFQPLLQAGAFPPAHPLHQILTKLTAIDEANTERWRQEFTFDWDLYFANLLVKITWCVRSLSLTRSLAVYHSQLQPPSPYIGLHASPIVLQFQFYSLLAVPVMPTPHA